MSVNEKEKEKEKSSPYSGMSTLEVGRAVLRSEAETLLRLSATLDERFAAAVDLMASAGAGQGHVVVMGIGKSGHVGRKIAATLASTGTPAFFTHATEAAHGDLGMLTSRDVVLAISYSGRTDELLAVIGPLRLIGARICCITGQTDSPLARASDVALLIGAMHEADPHNLAPTNTSTATLALGDALAVALSVRKCFTRMQFGKFHPGGALGRQVLGAQYPKFAIHNQQHVFRFLDVLSTKEKETLEKDLETIKLDELDGIWKTVSQGQGREIQPQELEPIKDIPHIKGLTPEQRERWTKIGLDALAAGKVGVVAFAGGQYWRMGAAMSIGMIDIGLPSHKTLFQLQFERIAKLMELCRKSNPAVQEVNIPVFIMTSHDMVLSVTDLLENNEYFGLPPRSFEVFAQRNLPCVDFEGKIILETPCKVASAPDGHGGLYTAMQDAQVLEKMEQRGIEYVFVYAVDNALVRVADPLYIGHCIDTGADFGYKVVSKADPMEPAGVVCRRSGKIDYVEHTELPKSCAEQDENGELSFNAANILNLFYTKQFLSQVVRTFKPKYHYAKRVIPYCNEKGERVVPQKPNGYRFVKFALDCTAIAKKVALLMVQREEEFAPVKRTWGENKDSPDTARAALCRLHLSYLRRAGAVLEDESVGTCEISPLVSYAGEGLDELVSGKEIHLPVHMAAPNETLTLSSRRSIF